MSVNLSKHSAMATSARPEDTAQAASRKATRPVAEAFSMWVTGSPVSPSSFMALMPSMEAGWMYPTKASSTSARVMPASCSASRPASRARCAPGMSLNMPKRTMPMPATATPSNSQAVLHAWHLPASAASAGRKR